MAIYTIAASTTNAPVTIKFSQDSMWGGTDKWTILGEHYGSGGWVRYFDTEGAALAVGDKIHFQKLDVSVDSPEITENALQMESPGIFNSSIRARVSGSDTFVAFKSNDNTWTFSTDAITEGTNGFYIELISYEEDPMEGNYWLVQPTEGPTPPPTPATTSVLGENAVAFFKGKVSNTVGLARALTEDDINYPDTGTKTTVALWKLPSGIYTNPNGLRVSPGNNYYTSSNDTWVVDYWRKVIGLRELEYYSNDMYSSLQEIITTNRVIDDLTSTDQGKPLSAKQGKVLNDKITAITDYSTTEVDTGATWIDGSHIYKITVDTGRLSNNATKSTQHGISNIDKIIKAEGFTWDSTNAGITSTFPIPFMSNDAGESIYLQVTDTTINITTEGGLYYNNYDSSWVTIWYTKSSS